MDGRDCLILTLILQIHQRSVKETDDISLSKLLCCEGVLHLSKRPTVHNVVLSQPSFACNTDPEPQVLKTLGAMRVGINHAFDSFFFCQRPPAPVEIYPFPPRIKLDPPPAFRPPLHNCP